MRIISCVAGYTGYIYIIHSVPILWRSKDFNIWENIFHLRYWYDCGMLIPAMLVTTMIVLAVGTVVGMVVEYLIIKKIIKTKAVEKTIEKVDSIYM